MLLNFFLHKRGDIIHGDPVVLLKIDSDFKSPVQPCT